MQNRDRHKTRIKNGANRFLPNCTRALFVNSERIQMNLIPCEREQFWIRSHIFFFFFRRIPIRGCHSELTVSIWDNPLHLPASILSLPYRPLCNPSTFFLVFLGVSYLATPCSGLVSQCALQVSSVHVRTTLILSLPAFPLSSDPT